jgi:tRNA pseudouridine55 synthase
VVDQVVRLMRGTKVGHAGTLDPLATGVLVICTGAATRLIEYVQRMPKTYRTVIRLGARSDTLDADGEVTEVEGAVPPDEARIRLALAQQVGTIEQRPPEFSALKVAGRRAYDLARAGLEVELAPRRVTIERIELIRYEWPRLELEIDCGSGTYIRSIARDAGEALGCGGLVEVLVRTRIGPFALADAVKPEALSIETLAAHLQPALAAVADLPRVALSGGQVADVVQGRPLASPAVVGGPLAGGEVALVGPEGTLVAVAEHDLGTGRILPRRVLVTA